MEEIEARGFPTKRWRSCEPAQGRDRFTREGGSQQAWRTRTGKVIGREEASPKMRTKA